MKTNSQLDSEEPSGHREHTVEDDEEPSGSRMKHYLERSWHGWWLQASMTFDWCRQGNGERNWHQSKDDKCCNIDTSTAQTLTCVMQRKLWNRWLKDLWNLRTCAISWHAWLASKFPHLKSNKTQDSPKPSFIKTLTKTKFPHQASYENQVYPPCIYQVSPSEI